MKSLLEPRRAKPFLTLQMRPTILIVLYFLTITARAKEWRNEIFHCGASIPEGHGWQMIEAPSAPGITPLIVIQNTAKQSVFGINVIEKFRGANLADPAVQRGLEAMLMQFGYQFVGHSNVNISGINWLQYPVHAGTGPQQVGGIVRYASMGGYVFSISMLRGGGQDATPDTELQQAAASFRMFPVGSVAANRAPGTNGETGASKTAGAASDKPAAEGADNAEEDNSKARMIWAGVAGLAVLVLFLSIISKKPAQ